MINRKKKKTSKRIAELKAKLQELSVKDDDIKRVRDMLKQEELNYKFLDKFNKELNSMFDEAMVKCEITPSEDPLYMYYKGRAMLLYNLMTGIRDSV